MSGVDGEEDFMRTANRPQVWCRYARAPSRLRYAGERRVSAGIHPAFRSATANCAQVKLHFLQPRRAATNGRALSSSEAQRVDVDRLLETFERDATKVLERKGLAEAELRNRVRHEDLLGIRVRAQSRCQLDSRTE